MNLGPAQGPLAGAITPGLRPTKECGQTGGSVSRVLPRAPPKARDGHAKRYPEEENLELDVVSGGEIAVAAAAGFPPAKMHFHGNNKKNSEYRSTFSIVNKINNNYKNTYFKKYDIIR